MTTRQYAQTTSGKRRPRLLSVIVPAIGLAILTTLPIQAVRGSAVAAGASPRPGAWTQLGPSQGGTTATLLHIANGNDLVVWMPPVVSSKYYYDAAELKPKGGMASPPANVFGGHDWDGVTFTPNLVSDQGQPLLVFEGGRDNIATDPYSRGCIVGDLLTPSGWQLQTWSLSANCLLDHVGSTISQTGTLTAAWPGGWVNGNGIQYRIGVSSTIPATAADQQISTQVGDAGSVSAATDASNQDAYASWARFFSKPASNDGLWVANLTKNSAPLKAPDTGTNLVASYPEPVAVASPTGRGGIYAAYCNDTSPCSRVELWRYGDKKSLVVPKSSNPRSVALSAGPSGRLWIAWWSSKDGTVRVVRTNEAGTAFGTVETHAGPHGCQSDGNASIRISSGSQQRLDVVMSCTDFTSSPAGVHASATQSLVPLQIAASTVAVNHKKGGSVTYRVSDVGDAVAGATVTVAGRKGKTDNKGQVTFRFPKGSKTGTFKVVATMTDYLGASTFLRTT
jgi:hypothetical protein